MTVDQANDILTDCGITNTDDSDRGDYLAYQEIRGVVNLCDCNTCTVCDGFESWTRQDVERDAIAWIESVA